ncbi:MAG TPA: MvaI/BcnI family restriction endonuclease [Gammaproteobacteria bacterium]
MTSTYDSAAARNLSLDSLRQILTDLGVDRILLKALAPNDNSKNQPYLGKDMSVLNVIPTGHISESDSTSKKQRIGKKGKKLTAPIEFYWVSPNGVALPAPESKLILYPQYSEVRFSGFMKRSEADVSEWMNPYKSGRNEGRYLVFGIAGAKVFGFLVIPGTRLATDLKNVPRVREIGVLFEIALAAAQEKVDAKYVLLRELRRIHELGWIQGKRLQQLGKYVDCNNSNCGGYTLEAELGVLPNGVAEPDFMGWEVKQYQVPTFTSAAGKPLTLMTPEPSGGFYREEGVEAFVRKFGYPDKNGKEDRLNFGGVHRFGQRHSTTALELDLVGADLRTGKFDPGGAIVLRNAGGEIAASWSFSKLLEHWKRKHSQAVYVPAQVRKNGSRYYSYGSQVWLGEGTDFMRLLKAIGSGSVYYDPGIKLVDASSTKPTTKRRSQFRINTQKLSALYDRYAHIDVTD